MTREEAIICKIYLEDLDKHHTCNEYKLLMKLLEQEPCDAISRQAVRKIIDDIRYCVSMKGYWAFLERLNKLPPVNPTSNISIQITERGKIWKI